MLIGASTRKVSRATAVILCAFAGFALEKSQAEEPIAPSMPPARNVRISFLPPPLDGTISLGIYDRENKLVRVLQRESDVEEFEIGSDALVTHWDGKDDADRPLPPGKYHASGFAVGDLEIEGIGFYFNDWVNAERPERVEKICAIAAGPDGVLVSARLKGNASETLLCDNAGKVVATPQENAAVVCDDQADARGLIATTSGKDHTRWVIERLTGNGGGSEVRQYSAANELLRRLAIPADQPQPLLIAAAADAERIYLLEEDAIGQRLRGLTLVATKGGADHGDSDWKVEFENRITAHAKFGLQDGKPIATGGEPPPEKVSVKLQPNPLRKDERTNVELAVGYDESGSFLKTQDGLPLQTVSDTVHLTRAVIAPHDAKSLDVFQDDGVVVEQFRVSKIDEMMAFDCGEIELK